jgi:CheY-like chemotaxis protein
VDLHGGSLEASSGGLNQGARFTARFKGGEAAGASAPVRANSTTEFRILLAEDNDDTRNCLVALLGSAGYEVLAAANVKTAVELADRHDLDLLIADLSLPDGTGAELLLKLRATAPALPAIAISGYGMPEDLLNSRAVGFSAHLIKPVQFAELKSVIQPLAEAKASSLGQTSSVV